MKFNGRVGAEVERRENKEAPKAGHLSVLFGAPFKKYIHITFLLPSFLLFFTHSADIFQVVHSVQYNETNMVLAFKILRV